MRETKEKTIEVDGLSFNVSYSPSTPDTLDGLGDYLEIYTIELDGVDLYDFLSRNIIDSIEENLVEYE